MHTVGNVPAHHEPAIYIKECDQIHKPFRHWDIRNVHLPDLVTLVDR
jgi:hypothetical protein